MKTKILLYLLIIGLLVLSFPINVSAEYADDEWDEHWQYRLLDDGAIEIIGYDCYNHSKEWQDPEAWEDFDNMIIPDKINGKTVSSITDNGSFSYWRFPPHMKTVTIPNSIVIKRNPFRERTEFAIYRATKFNDTWYEDVSSISDIIISEDHPTLKKENGMIIDKQEKKIVVCLGDHGNIPDDVEILGDNCGLYFSRITIPESVKTIEDGVFNEEYGSLVIPNTVTSLIGNPFSNFWGTTDHFSLIISQDHPTLEYINDCLISKEDHRLISCFSSSKKKSIVVPEGVKIISPRAFLSDKISDITLPSTLEKIGDHAFSATKIKKIIIPEGVKEIGEDVFPSSLTSISLPKTLRKFELFNTFSSCKSSLTITVIAHSYLYTELHYDPYIYIPYKIKVYYPVTRIDLSETEISIQKNKTAALKTTILPKEANNKKVEWISTDPSIATVKNGKIKAVSAGSCDIICRALDGYGAEAVCHVTVTERD